jgi:hypothetical protein
MAVSRQRLSLEKIMAAPPESAPWILPTLLAFVGAGVYAGIWLVVDGLGVGQGPGRLHSSPWPFNSLPAIAFLGAISGAVVGMRVHAYRALRQVTASDPIEPLPETDATADFVLSDLPRLPAFVGGFDLSRRSAERVGDVTADVFDLTVEEGDSDSTALVTRTVVLLPAEGLPGFEFRPRRPTDRLLSWAGATGLRFDAAAVQTTDDADIVNRFEATYRLAIVSPQSMISGAVEESDEAVRRVFLLETMRLTLRRSDWTIQSHGGYLACWETPTPWTRPRHGLGTKRRARLVTDAVALRTAFLDAQAGKTTGQIIPAPGGAVSLTRQAARLQASLLGGLLGLVGGFFLFWVTFFTRPVGNLSIFLLPVFCLLGAALWATIGRLLPLRRPMLPKPPKPADPRRDKVIGCGILTGLFGGFFAGAIAGAILGDWLVLGFDQGMLLFFGGACIGLITGPIVFGLATRFLYKWWKGNRG